MWTSSGWRGLGELKRLGIVLQVSTALSGMSPPPGPWRGYEAGTGSLVHKPRGWQIRLLPLSPRGRGVRGEGEGTVLGMTSPPHPRPLSLLGEVCSGHTIYAAGDARVRAAGTVVGHGSGDVRPSNNTPARSSVFTMAIRPRTNTLMTRPRSDGAVAGRAASVRFPGGDTAPSWHALSVQGGTVSTARPISASPPTRRHHQVDTASTSHSRSARRGSVMCVFCQSQPPLLSRLNPCSIQARKPYQQTSAASGARSVSTSQGSAYPASRRASSVHRSRLGASLKASPTPFQDWPSGGTKLARARRCFSPRNRNEPAVLMRMSGC